jgi:hypothetical protein
LIDIDQIAHMQAALDLAASCRSSSTAGSSPGKLVFLNPGASGVKPRHAGCKSDRREEVNPADAGLAGNPSTHLIQWRADISL